MSGADDLEGSSQPRSTGGRGSRGASRAQGSGGPRKPRTWVAVDEDGEPIPLTEQQAEKLRERAQNLCLWHLAQKACTRKQLLDAMTKKGVPAEMAEAVLGKLAEYNYVNDSAFADNFVRSRHHSARKAASAIRYELRSKGVDPDTIEQALEQVTAESEADNARLLVARKLGSTAGLDRSKRTNRLVGMLARKGYPPGLAYQVVREALEAEESDDEDWDGR